jgi:hypothetical protein
MMKQMMALLLMFLPMQQAKHPDTPKTISGITGPCDGVTCPGIVMDTISMPEPEVSWGSPKIRNHRKTYTLDVKENWTCVPSSNSIPSGYGYWDVSLVTITCVKSDSRGEAQ